MNIRTVFRVAGIGLILFGLVANIPQGWAIASVGVGLAGIFFCGGGGG